VLLCVAVCCGGMLLTLLLRVLLPIMSVGCSVLQYVAVSCSVWKVLLLCMRFLIRCVCVAVYSSVLQCVAVCCSVLQCVAVGCC